MIKFIFYLLALTCLKLVACWPITYYYYDRDQVNGLVLSNNSILGSPYNSSKKTDILIHGFNDVYNMPYNLEIKDQLISLEDSNVILVDWSQGAAGPLVRYPIAAANTPLVGRNVADFIVNNNIDPANVYCIGFSLGAHVCGFVGKRLPGLARITGLDPAGPLFNLQPASSRLASTDAQLVDCIHTSLLGVFDPICDKDFYPNGGIDQPGCPTVTDGGVCNHMKALVYYIESMREGCDFFSTICYENHGLFNGTCECDPILGCSRMGYYADQNNQTGRFFLDTFYNTTCSRTGSSMFALFTSRTFIVLGLACVVSLGFLIFHYI